jgi:hypothetical protein
MLGGMSTASRFVLLALLTAALAPLGGGRAAAQETEYDPQGRALAPSTVPEGYATPDAGAPPTTATPTPTALPSDTPPPAPAPAPAPSAPSPGPYELEGDANPHYPGAVTAERDDETTDEGVRIPSRISARLRVLDRDYTALSVGGSSGVVDGILSIVMGGISIALGAVVPDTANDYATYLYIFGAGGVAHGIVELLVTPDPVDPALIFAHMPMRDVEEVKARLRYGEESLEKLADRASLSRILEGSIDIATGVAFIPFYLGPRDYALTGDYLDIVMMTAALIRVVTGVATLIIRSEPERRWSAYSDLRDELRRQRQQEHRVHADVGAAALPGGGAVTLTGTF